MFGKQRRGRCVATRTTRPYQQVIAWTRADSVATKCFMAVADVLVRGTWPWPPGEVAKVAQLVVALFGIDEEASTPRLLIEPSGARDVCPMALSTKSDDNRFVIRLKLEPPGYWTQFVFQLGHELCHVLADATTFRDDRFRWIEEVLCETASLYALRNISLEFAEPPDWDAAAFRATADIWLRRHDHVAPSDQSTDEWLACRRDWLTAGGWDDAKQSACVPIAATLLPVFERSPDQWRVVHCLHAWHRDADDDLAEFLQEWESRISGSLPAAIRALFGDAAISASTPESHGAG